MSIESFTSSHRALVAEKHSEDLLCASLEYGEATSASAGLKESDGLSN